MSLEVTAHAALPEPLRLQPSFPFVDRPREMATLRSLLPRAHSEGRRIALVGGEPGSGKSRLVREIAHQAAQDGALVLYGACDAVVRTPYRPFVEALDQLVRASDPHELRDDLGPAGGELTRLLPDLRSHVGDLPEPVVADQDTERHRLNAAVSARLGGAGRRRPLLLVFEDGHWADTPTLLLLRHLAAGASEARMLLVATFRDTEADVPAELSEALIDMRRSDGVVRVRVGGLTGEQVSEFVERAAGAPLGPAPPAPAGAGAPRAGGGHHQPHAGQRVPRHGAVARAGGDGSPRDRGRRGHPDTAAERARHPRERARGGQPAAGAAAAGDGAGAGAGRGDRARVRPVGAPRRRVQRCHAGGRAGAVAAPRHDRGDPGQAAPIPVLARARAPRPV